MLSGGAGVEAVIDPRLPVSPKACTSDDGEVDGRAVEPGQSDFEAIGRFVRDRFFKGSPRSDQGPSSALDAPAARCQGAELRELTDELSLRLLGDAREAPITAWGLRLPTSTPSSWTIPIPEGDVSHLPKGGWLPPIAAYLGNEAGASAWNCVRVPAHGF